MECIGSINNCFPVARDLRFAIAADCKGIVRIDLHRAVLADADILIVAEVTGFITPDPGVHITLGMDIDLLMAGLVIESKFVCPRSRFVIQRLGGTRWHHFLVGFRAPCCLGLFRIITFFAEVVARHISIIEHPADNNRTIGIAVNKVDEYFMADARQNDVAEPAGLRDAYPTA